MDNRLNEVRRKIRAFRVEMKGAETEMRGHIAHDRDCAAAGTRLLAMRKELTLMIEEFTALGGAVSLPSVDERLSENYRPASRVGGVNILPPKTKSQRRRLERRI